MNLSVTVTLSGDDVTRRKAADVEDAVVAAIVVQAEGAKPVVTYPAHRNGAMGFVVTVGEPAPKQSRARKPKPAQPDPAVPIDDADIPAGGAE